MRLRYLLLSVALVVATACSDPEAEDAPSASTVASGPASPGATVLEGHVIGDADHPGYTVEVPEGWSTEDGGFMVKEGPDALGLSVWDVGVVPGHPCHWKGTETKPGPTVDDLVDALTSQALRDPTVPTEVVLANHQGQYLEWSVPNDRVVTNDSDFKGCDDPGNGHQDFVSWWGTDGGERYQQAPGQVDRLWVLDVDGQTLLVDATYTLDTSDVDREELEQVAASLRFVDA
jgi:hypothetical protein